MRSRGALFWCASAVAVLLLLRPVVRALDAPTAVRLSLGILLVLTLLAVSGLLVAGRIQGDLDARRALGGLFFVALFLVPFALVVHGRDATWPEVVVGLAGAIGVVIIGWGPVRAQG